MLESLLRFTLTLLLKLFFRVNVRGLEHYHASGDKVVIIANHQSFLDPLLLAVFLPEKPCFAMNAFQAEKWYFRPLLKLVTVFRVDPSQAITMKSLIQRLRRGGKVVIFPEGRITTTGGIMRVYEGAGHIIDRTDATILPVHIEGAQFSYFSLLGGKVRQRLFPKITLTFQPPRKLSISGETQGRARRTLAAQILYDALVESMFRANFQPKPLLQEILHAAKRYGWTKTIAEDPNRKSLRYRSLFARMFVLARGLQPQLGAAQNVAILMPTTLAGMVAFLSLHRLGKTPAMLNFSAGLRNIELACQTATVDTIITSHTFVEKGKLEPIIEALSSKYRIIYLEDIKEKLTRKDKLLGLLEAFCPVYSLKVSLNTPAVILFTSGSEGIPKGVALSHANILANIWQAAARLSFTNRDVMFNAMPIFHSFGLSIGTLLPLCLGIRTFLYPSPLHYRVIPELAYDVNASILLGTDTFFRGYATYAHDFDFQSVRLCVAGAEKLKPETRQLWWERFRVDILQGYGVTEASPAISFNTPLEHKTNTTGRIFPCMEARLEAVEGLSQGGVLHVKGPNIMMGYIRHENPGAIIPQAEWYDTGDIADIDSQGFISIIGRAKRFAKIGGEMVSLSVIEELASVHWPDFTHAAIALSDPRKGEQIILFSESEEVTRSLLTHYAADAGLPELILPRQVILLSEIPRLGSGKIDYISLKEMALNN